MLKSLISENLSSPPIAFFCAEYAITSDESMYAGGLGVLAGDFILEAADQKMPLIAFGIKYQKTKTTENGFELLSDADGKPVIVEVPIGENENSKKILLKFWVKAFGEKTFLILLDCNLADNAPDSCNMGDLYDQNNSVRLKQEVFLGIGAVKLLKVLGITPKKYHLNEGNMAFAALAVMAEEKLSLEEVKRKVVSTKHTILSIGTKVTADELWKTLGSYCAGHGISKEYLMSLGAYRGDQNIFATTHFLLSLSGKSNGVSVIHTVSEKKKYPESQLIPITNGVYVPRWKSARWGKFSDFSKMSDKEIWAIKKELRQELVNYVKEISGTALSSDVCTLVWTRRFAPYKRPLTIFTDMLRLKNIISNSSKPLQIIMSGKLAGKDPESIKMVDKVRDMARDPMFEGKIAFIPDYSLEMAKKFVAGSDIWLNTPERGVEACGTSGMKAGLNGALMVSVSDGWMDEVDWKNIGWILSAENDKIAESLYGFLEKEILPEFYDQGSDGVPESWIRRMRATMKIVENNFSATKMIAAYYEKMYGDN